MIDPIINNKLLLIAIIIVFISRQIVTWHDIRILRYLLTPLVTILILAVSFNGLIMNTASFYITMIFWGLVLSLVADVILMIKEFHTLQYGLVYFLSAHICYIIAFAQKFQYQNWNIVIMVLLVPAMVYLFIKMHKNAGKLALPLAVYMCAISIMVYLGLSALGHNPSSGTIYGAAGAVLFLLSDVILGINAFIKPVKNSSVFVWCLYAPGQLLIAFSCM